ncbi:hypothetical protein Tco_0484622 [Tanacetum coccineum]
MLKVASLPILRPVSSKVKEIGIPEDVEGLRMTAYFINQRHQTPSIARHCDRLSVLSFHQQFTSTASNGNPIS